MKDRICLFLFFLSFLGYGQSPGEIKFIWKSAQSESQKFEKAVMLLPVIFQGDTTTYFLQFDTGASYSSLYKNRLDYLQFSSGDLSTSLGKINFKENYSMKTSTNEIHSVGTLGADFLRDKIVHVNYENQVIKIGHAYNPAEYELQPLEVLNGRPVIKIQIGAKLENFLFDTGSGLFGIWTTKNNWYRWRDKNDPPKTFPIVSWGEINIGVYSRFDRSASVSFGKGIRFENVQIWYIKNRKFNRFFRNNDLVGLVGNQPFYKKEIILDYKRNLFGIKLSP